MTTLNDAQEACSLIGRAQLAAREALIAGDLSMGMSHLFEAQAQSENALDVIKALIEAQNGGGK